MTKEDVIEILERFVLGAKPCSQKEIVDACVSAYRMLKEQPSLPSNLDEAAEKEIERFCSDMLNVDIIWARMPLTKRFGLQMAKFGAEWMAGQYEKIEGELVDWYSTSDGKDYCCGVKTIETFEAPEGFYIRKKQ